MKIKYVIFDDVLPVLLSKGQQHSDIRCGREPTSAGFCSFQRGGADALGDYEVSCWGESISLTLKVGPADEDLIRRMLEDY